MVATHRLVVVSRIAIRARFTPAYGMRVHEQTAKWQPQLPPGDEHGSSVEQAMWRAMSALQSVRQSLWSYGYAASQPDDWRAAVARDQAGQRLQRDDVLVPLTEAAKACGTPDLALSDGGIRYFGPGRNEYVGWAEHHGRFQQWELELALGMAHTELVKCLRDHGSGQRTVRLDIAFDDDERMAAVTARQPGLERVAECAEPLLKLADFTPMPGTSKAAVDVSWSTQPPTLHVRRDPPTHVADCGIRNVAGTAGNACRFSRGLRELVDWDSPAP